MGLFSKTEEPSVEETTDAVEETPAIEEIRVAPTAVLITSDGVVTVSLFNQGGDTDIIQEFHADDLGEEASQALLTQFGLLGQVAAFFASDELASLEAKIRGLTNG